MKKYILKKDLPLAKAGTEVTMENDWIWVNWIQIDDYKISNIDITNTMNWLEEVKENKRWRAERNEKYFYVEYNRVVGTFEWFDFIDDWNFKTQNYYRTEKEAQKALDRINAIADINEIIDEMNGEENNWKIQIYYNTDELRYDWYVMDDCKYADIIHPQSCSETAVVIIENHKDKLDLIFNI